MYFLYNPEHRIVGSNYGAKLVYKGQIVTNPKNKSNNQRVGVLHQSTLVTDNDLNLLPVVVSRTQKVGRFDKKSHDFELKILVNKHPNIIKYYGWGEDENFDYKIFELCECSVYDILNGNKNKTVYFDDIVNSLSGKEILKQTLNGLTFIHSLGLYHGNIHPENVLISKTDHNQFVVKLTDFKQKIDATDATGTLVKEGWVFPDIFNQTNDHKNDSFVFGCFTFFLFSNKHPFGNNVVDQKCNIKNKEFNVYKKSWTGLTVTDLCAPFDRGIQQSELDKINTLLKQLIVFSKEERIQLTNVSLTF